MTWCPPIYRKRKQKMQEKRQVRKTEKGKTVEELVPRRFWKWKKVFGKKESERMPMGSCNRIKRGVCTQKRKSVFAVKGKKRGSTSIYEGLTAKGIYSAVKITTDLTSLFCSKEE